MTDPSPQMSSVGALNPVRRPPLTTRLGVHLGLAALLVGLCCLISQPSFGQTAQAPIVPAQDVFGVGQLLFGSDVTRAKSEPSAFRSGRDAGPIVVGDWLAYPTMDAGVFYDDNLYASRTNQVGDFGLRLRPTIVGTRKTGIHDTTAYGTADGRLFADNPRVNTIQGTVGLTHKYEITRDLVLRLQGEYNHKADDFGQAILSDSLRGVLIPPVQYDQIFLSSSLRQDFDQYFVGVGGSYMSTTFDTIRDSLRQIQDQSYRNETDTRLIGRVGYKFSPALYAFVEPSLIWQSFKVPTYDSTGTRVIAGLGSDRLSLFSGEIFGGYQDQEFDDKQLRSGGGPVFGGRVSWFPTRDISLTTVIERSIGFSGLASGLNRLNTGAGLDPTFQSNVLNPIQQTISKTTTFGVQGSYVVTRELSADAGAGYQVSSYGGNDTELLSAQVGLKYLLLKNLGLRLDYAYSRASTSEPLYTRNRVTLGVYGQL